MTTRVLSIKPDAPILEAVRLMLRHRISGLPVVDDGDNLVGIVTESDFLRRPETGTLRRPSRWLEFLLGPGRLATEYVRSHGRRVGDVMTTDVVSITEETPLREAVHLMEQRHVKRLPVVHGSQVVGIISRANLMHALASAVHKLDRLSVSDKAIRDRILTDLKSEPWAPGLGINVLVRDGVVELWGMILDEQGRQALRVAAENVPGVKGVTDHLVSTERTFATAYKQTPSRTQC